MPKQHYGKSTSVGASPMGRNLASFETTVDKKSLSKCKYCSKPIAWLESKKGKMYPVDYGGELSNSGNPIVVIYDFHSCPDKPKR